MEYFDDSLLIKSPPTKRAAYSDRTAWIMAELSRLVYETLPGEKALQKRVDKIYCLAKKNRTQKEVESLIKEAIEFDEDDSIIKKKLPDNEVKISFVQGFDELGTQAMLVEFEKTEDFDGMLILVFRGTEVTSIEDIKTDLKANLVPAKGDGKIHKGFKDAYELIEKELKEEIEKFNKEKKLPLYITGHSLGGALAITATKYLGSDTTGATYTFGGPRVGDDAFFKNIKTPVYRVVNQADAVPRLPFGAGFAYFLAVVNFIPINGTKRVAEWFRKNFSGFTHHGTMVFLAEDENNEIIIKNSPSIFWRFPYIVPRLMQTKFKATIQDHSMEAYCDKLRRYAYKRNEEN